MKVKELIEELGKCNPEAQVFYDTWETYFFQKVVALFGKEINYPDGSVDGIEQVGQGADCLVWLKEGKP